MPIEKALVVEDEKLTREFISAALKKLKIEVFTADSVEKAKKLLKKHPFDLLLADLHLPDGVGLSLLAEFKESHPEGISVVMTGHGSTESAVEAMRLGAFHYLQKPFSIDALEIIIEKAKERLKLQREKNFYEQELNQTPPRLIAHGKKMEQLIHDIEQVAKTDATVFIYGETGTGKEVVANMIHSHSQRSGLPFIKTNCAAIPETLLESEFFGHEKGAFTGALQKRIGRFEMANKGTLLLDEVTEMPLALQAKLLRAIEEKEFERVGGTATLHVDVRILSTSNRDPKKAIEQGKFREDLFYRLHVIPLHLPPLRERKEEILPLAHLFLESFSQGRLKLSKEAEQSLLGYSWPGNVRELKNILERASVLAQGEIVSPALLFPHPAVDLDILEDMLELQESSDSVN